MIDEYDAIIQEWRKAKEHADKTDFLQRHRFHAYSNVYDGPTDEQIERFKSNLDLHAKVIEKAKDKIEELENLPPHKRAWKKTQDEIDFQKNKIRRSSIEYHSLIFHGKNLGWVKGDEEE